MRRFRQHLSIVLCGWLFTQLLALAVPVALAAGAAQAEDLCTCAGGDHDACPMHHGHPQDASTCAMRSLHAPTDVALLSLAGGTGVLPQILVVTHLGTSAPIDSADPYLSAISVPFDSPPPRS